MIRLKGILDVELRVLGLKPGDIIQDHQGPKLNGAIYFTITGQTPFAQECVVWKENYDILEEGGES